MAGARPARSCGTRCSAIIFAPAGAILVAVIFRVLSMTFGDRPGNKVETTPTLLILYGAMRVTGFAFPAAATAWSRADRVTANGMILTVAILSPPTPGF